MGKLALFLGVTLAGSQPVFSVSSCPLGEQTAPHCDDGNFWNGYWWRDYWVPGYPSIESWYTPAPEWFYGKALFYGPGAMEATAQWRGMDLTGFVDGVALMSPADIGLTVWLKRPGHDWEGPFLVVDAAARGDIYPIVVHWNDAVEVGYKTAVSWGMVENGQVKKWMIEDVEISKIHPRHLWNYPRIEYRSWFLSNFKADTTFTFGTPLYLPPSTWRINGEWVTFTQPQIICGPLMC